MAKSAFHLAFDADLCRTALEDPDLGARVLAERPQLEGAGPAELIAGGRTLRAAGPISPKLALRLAAALLDLGGRDEAIAILDDGAADFQGREAARSGLLARALAAAGDLGAARAALARAEAAGLERTAPALARTLAQALGLAAIDSPAPLADELCGLRLPALAAQVLNAPLGAGTDGVDGEALLNAAFGTLRLADAATAAGLLDAMTPLYRAAGREASLRATLAVLAGGTDAGVEAESEGSSAFELLLRACLAEACAAARIWPAAIRRLDMAGRKWRDPGDSLCELARCVGRDLLDHARIRLLPPGGPPKVFDLFPYNGEVVMLQLKLREMAGWVERFVLVEADQTFTGQPKPLYYGQDPQAAAGEFAGRVARAAVGRPAAHVDCTWAREFFQKDHSVLALDGLARPDDLVILSDADEILHRAPVEGFRGDVASGALRTFRYYFNCEVQSPTPLLKATVTSARQAAAHGWNYLRLGAGRYRRAEHLPDAGWHFSSIGDARQLAYKMKCTAHEEWAFMDQSWFERKLPKMRRALGPGLVRREIDDSFPASLRQMQAALADLIL
jgi:beta-1,4-mannosyl-glycoprotein beta-1,4-N-acetylglucosaminyltransferase